MAWVLFAQQNTVKTAIRNSRINFYFVTSFYSLYDICMVAQVHRRVGCDDATSEVSTILSEESLVKNDRK